METEMKKLDLVGTADTDVEIGTIHNERMPHSLRNLSQDEISDLNRKLVRKIDCIVLPIISILYILNYIDRQNLAAAKLQGIMEDLDMTTQQFATAISILFVGYLPFQMCLHKKYARHTLTSYLHVCRSLQRSRGLDFTSAWLWSSGGRYLLRRQL